MSTPLARLLQYGNSRPNSTSMENFSRLTFENRFFFGPTAADDTLENQIDYLEATMDEIDQTLRGPHDVNAIIMVIMVCLDAIAGVFGVNHWINNS